MLEMLLEEYKNYEIEVFFQEVENKSYQFKYKKLDSVQASKSIGTGIRVYSEGKIGQYYSTEANPNYKEMIEKAIASLKYSREGKFLPKLSSELIEKQTVKAASESEIKKILTLMENCIEANSSQEVSFPESSFSVSRVKQGFIKKGSHLEQESESYTVVFYAKATSSSEEESGYDYSVTKNLNELDLMEIAKNAKEKTLKMLGAQSCSAEISVELDYSIVIEFLELLLFSFSAENIVKRQSLFLQERHKKLDEKLTIVDDGMLEGGIATSLFDGEGQKRQKTVLVEKGEVKNYLSNLEMAQTLEIASSGNAARKNLIQVGISPTNIVVEPGKLTADEYDGLVKRKVLITEVMGLHMVNPITGEFSLGAKGFLIEDGQEKAVRGFVISGNFVEVFKSIKAISPTVKQYGNFLVPKMLVDNIKITG